ncbi:MAG: GDP-mannose 4,6-dehydratase [Verrucomicrobia bacterium]|nr:GDP-mannose 4,6-dehydratase [Verrucomicrobiota bacterium]
MKRALITGISGQDGAYLANHLLGLGYELWGTSRDAQVASFRNLERLGIKEQVRLESLAVNDFRSVLQVLAKVQPDEVYNLGGQTSVSLSFQQPVETLESISVSTLNFLECIRFIGRPIRFYNAGSSECYGDLNGAPANELTPFRPRSPYAVAKATAYWQVANYREAYGLYACSGILFNHESPLRPERFVTKKIASAVARILLGRQKELVLGNTGVWRDWGWAPEYVQAMHSMLQLNEPQDFVIATGLSCSLQEFVEVAFRHVGLEPGRYVKVDKDLFRPTEIEVSRGDASKAASELNWQAQTKMPDVAKLLVEDCVRELERTNVDPQIAPL